MLESVNLDFITNIMFNKLFAICLLVEDFDNSLFFYRDTLGLKVNQTNETFADFKVKGTSIAIFQKSEATSMFPQKYMKPGGGAVIAFQVTDLEGGVSELKRKGVEIFEGPKTTPWGQKVAYFLDPDKNIWEISEK